MTKARGRVFSALGKVAGYLFTGMGGPLSRYANELAGIIELLHLIWCERKPSPRL
jgi:hypothetical protein